MKPSATEIAARIDTLVESHWPQNLEGLPSWLSDMGIDFHSSKEASSEGYTQFWHSAAVTDWASAKAGWVTYQGKLGDINWFLWTGEAAAAVAHGAQELVDILSDKYGVPEIHTEVNEVSGGNWFWVFGDHSIDLYVHSGAPRPNGDSTSPSGLQLHISLLEVAAKLEAEAQQLQTESLKH